MSFQAAEQSGARSGNTLADPLASRHQRPTAFLNERRLLFVSLAPGSPCRNDYRAIRPVIVVPATNDSVAQRTEFLGARFRVEAEVWSKRHRLLSAAGRPQFLRPSLNMAIAVARYKRTVSYIQHASANRCARTREQAGQSRMFHRRATDVALDGFNFSTVSLARS
jgi:hypothetical protein